MISIISTLNTITKIFSLLEFVHKRIVIKFVKSKKPFIESINLEKTPFFHYNESLHFDRVTAIIGRNSSGKTAICEWLSVLGGDNYLTRWMSPSGALPLIYMIKYTDYQKQHHKVRIAINKKVR